MLEDVPPQGATIGEDRIICKKCGHQCAEGSRFCSQCGSKLQQTVRCSRCRREIADDATLGTGYVDEILGDEDRGEGDTPPSAICCLGCGKYYHRECYAEKGCGCGIVY